ncbi:MAG: NDP-sugar synthase [Myxococcales bacterium]|nr:NDP-sugar synthase [Myxococcales bacterium]
MKAMLLCAGYGTRLGALSDDCPKPMLPVCDIPIVRYGIANLVAHGITDIVINLHHRGDVFQRELGDGRAFGANLSYSQEETILGTGGGLKHALSLLDPQGTDEPFISCNGKLIFDFDVAALRAQFAIAERAHGSLGMMVVQPVDDAAAWGAVQVDTAGDVPRVEDILGAGRHMFCGVHITRPSVVARLPDGEACMVRQGYLPWLRGGAHVGAYVHRDGYFAEHSTPQRYLASNWAMLDRVVLRHPPATLTGVDPRAEIAADVVIREPVRIAAGARIGEGAVVGPYVVVGAGARVAPHVTLRHAVVWRGAACVRDAENAIINQHGVVQA